MKSKLNKGEILDLQDQAAEKNKSEIVKESLEEQTDLIQVFFLNRLHELRMFLWFVVLRILYFQLKDLSKPMSEKHFQINVYYCCLSALLILMLTVSHRKPSYFKLMLPVSTLVFYRLLFRLLDFEKTRLL
jgi:hypothetical protein